MHARDITVVSFALHAGTSPLTNPDMISSPHAPQKALQQRCLGMKQLLSAPSNLHIDAASVQVISKQICHPLSFTEVRHIGRFNEMKQLQIIAVSNF